MISRLELSRVQILSFRRNVNYLDARLPAGATSLRRAAWAGLQDSVPRAALLSLHARVNGTMSNGWEHSSLVQLWGPRFNAYAVFAKDLALFSLGRLPDDERRRARAVNTADRLRIVLDGRRMPFGEAGRAMGVVPNSLRYAAPTGTVVMRWDGARQPVIWNVPAPAMEPQQARGELVRRYLHILGPGNAGSFAKWAGIRDAEANSAFRALARELMAVRTPVGEAWILAEDEAGFRTNRRSAALARLLPSGDAYFLLWGNDRTILVPDASRRAELWTTRVWPGAVLVDGEIAGIWRRSNRELSVEAWRKFTRAEREAVEEEVAALPLAGLSGPISIRWS